MKSFKEWTREEAITFLLDDVTTTLGYFWDALNPSLKRADPKLFSELQAELDGELVSQARKDLEELSTPELCRMSDQSIAATDLRREFAELYLAVLAERLDDLFQHAL